LKPRPHKYGVLQIDTSYGTDCTYAVQQFAKVHRLPAPVVATTTPTSTDESVNIASLRAHGVDTLVLCTYQTPTTGALSAAFSAGWHPNILAATEAAAFATVVLPTVPRAAYAKLYGVEPTLYPLAGSKQLNTLLKSLRPYAPTINASAVGGILPAELFVAYLKQAGKKLTRASFLAGLYRGAVDAAGFSEPVKILRGDHPEVVHDQVIATFPNATTERFKALVGPPSNVKMRGA
jgi:hypothetical protein